MARAAGAAAARGGLLAPALAVGTGAFLLFQVQPLIARFVLPWFGGAPSVWTLCMLFFQSLLLAGYAWSHVLVRRCPPGGQAGAQIALLLASLLLLPIVPAADARPAPDASPGPALLLLLLTVVGLPYFALATTAPLVQSWFARGNPDRSPYGLYAISTHNGELLQRIDQREGFFARPSLGHGYLLIMGNNGILYAMSVL